MQSSDSSLWERIQNEEVSHLTRATLGNDLNFRFLLRSGAEIAGFQELPPPRRKRLRLVTIQQAKKRCTASKNCLESGTWRCKEPWSGRFWHTAWIQFRLRKERLVIFRSKSGVIKEGHPNNNMALLDRWRGYFSELLNRL